MKKYKLCYCFSLCFRWNVAVSVSVSEDLFLILYMLNVMGKKNPKLRKLHFFGLEGYWGQPQGPNFPSPRATMLALHLDCSTAALTTPQKVLSILRLVELKMLDFRDRKRTGISILTSAADQRKLHVNNKY